MGGLRTKTFSSLARKTHEVDTSLSAKSRATFVIPSSSRKAVGMISVKCLTNTPRNARSRSEKNLSSYHSPPLNCFPCPTCLSQVGKIKTPAERASAGPFYMSACGRAPPPLLFTLLYQMKSSPFTTHFEQKEFPFQSA